MVGMLAVLKGILVQQHLLLLLLTGWQAGAARTAAKPAATVAVSQPYQ
jgi:hypothetical protein